MSKRKPELHAFLREVVIEPYEATAYGATPGPTKVSDVWTEAVLSDDRWLLAARIVPDERGNAVIAEVRIFPNERNRPREYSGSGCWGGEVLGAGATNIPRGGVPGTLLRRGVQLSEVERHARNMLNRSPWLRIKGLPDDHPLVRAAARLSQVGFKASTRPMSPKGKSSLGRPRLDDRVYATLARDYVEAFNRTGRPVPELAKGRGKPPAAIRSMIARARDKGFLSTAVKHGTGGGTLTEKSLQILGLQRVATEAQTGGVKTPQVRIGRNKNARHSTGGNSGR